MDNETKAEAVNLVSEIPVIGKFIKLGLFIGPPFLAFLLIFLLPEGLRDFLFNEKTYVLILSLIMMGWLKFLENRVGIRWVVPIIKLPWLWITWAGVALGIVMLIGGLFGWL